MIPPEESGEHPFVMKIIRYCDFHAGNPACNILVTGVGNRMLPDHRFPVVLADDNLLVFQNNTQKLRFQKLTDIRNIEMLPSRTICLR